MRSLKAMAAALVLTACASSSEDERFRVGQSENAFIIIGVAEAAANTSASYEVLWRQVEETGAFAEIGGRRQFQAQTNSNNSLRIRGTPGEFILVEVTPGVYALDGVFATIRDDRVDYVANGVVLGPERPSFEVRPGEAIYLGIWQVNIEDSAAVVRPWRLSETDLRAIMNEQNAFIGPAQIRETSTRVVQCTPHRINRVSQRQVC
jgi:hypothetical protein